MLFTQKKKRQQDSEAGLVFPWRGIPSRYMNRVTSFFVTALIFFIFIYAIRIEGIEKPVTTYQTSSVIYLDESDPSLSQLFLEIEQKSPFPVRWDPISEKQSLARLRAQVDPSSVEQWQYSPELRSVVDVSTKRNLLAPYVPPLLKP